MKLRPVKLYKPTARKPPITIGSFPVTEEYADIPLLLTTIFEYWVQSSEREMQSEETSSA
jgi:hypothetical protein